MSFLYILLALAVLLVMITVHEFGHYCAGKVLGFKINEFAIGFGPAIFKRKKKDGEQFSIRALPLGGFCAFEGEDEDGKNNPEAFNNKPAWKRVIVLVSGVTFNFLFGVLTAAIYLLVTGFSVSKISTALNSAEITGSGLQRNDIVLEVDGKKIEAYRSFNQMLADYEAGETFTLTIERDGKIIDVVSSKQKYDAFYFVADASKFEGKLFDENGEAVSIETFSDEIVKIATTTENEENAGKGSAISAYITSLYKNSEKTEQYSTDDIEEYLSEGTIAYASSGVSLGVIISNVEQKYTFFESIGKAWPFCFYLCGLIIDSFVGLFSGAVAVSEAGGTITAISQIAEISQYGLSYFLLLLPLLAMNLAVFNILPIPALDGARVVFVLIEMIIRRPINRKVEGWIHTIGLFVLLGLVIFLDINHFVSAFRMLHYLRI